MTKTQREKLPANDELHAFLQTRIQEMNKSLRTSIGLGITVLVLLCLYLGGSLYMVHQILQPDITAHMIANNVKEHWPTLLAETERIVIERVPTVADALGREVELLLPRIREYAQEQLDMTYRDMLPALEKELCATIRECARENRSYAADLYQLHQDRLFVKLFIEEIVDASLHSLDDQLRRVAPARGLDYWRHISLRAVRHIEVQLSDLAGKDTHQMSRSEQLQRRLIVTWLHILEDALLARQPASMEN